MIVDNKNQAGTQNPAKAVIQNFFKKKEGGYQKVLLGVSIFVLLSLFFETSYDSKKFDNINFALSFVFIGDFVYRLYVSENKIKFFKECWIDLLLSLPFYAPTWRIVVYALRSIKIILEFVLVEIKSAFYSMLAIGASLVMFSTISILQFETLPECNIKSIWDAAWWSLCTITTVGYGDKFPMTDGGKVVAMILMISGIGLFGTLIGYVSTFFTDKEKKDNDKIDTIEELSQQIAELSNKNKNSISVNDKVRVTVPAGFDFPNLRGQTLIVHSIDRNGMCEIELDGYIYPHKLGLEGELEKVN